MATDVPLVSIVIPTFNQDIIIVDGGSSDGTKKYLEGLSKEIAERTVKPVTAMDQNGEIQREEMSAYPEGRELKILVFEKDIGPTRTYNEGLARATGEYCTYVVGDDLPHPNMIEELVFALESTGADFAYSDMNVVDDEGRIVRQMRLPAYSFEACFARWYHLGVSHVYRTEWHEKVGLMDESYQGANDYDHYLRFAMAGCTFHHVSKILYSIRYHDDSRKKGQHTKERYANLIEESKLCATRARKWLSGKLDGQKK
jgi:glycosyltransferase involved in cell wall biosynthesis